MANSHSKGKPRIDEYSVVLGVLLAVFAQAGYDSFKTYYQLNYGILGPYFPSEWAGVVMDLLIVGLYPIRLRWKKLVLVSDEG